VHPINRSKEHAIIAENRGTRRQIVVEKRKLEQAVEKINHKLPVSSVRRRDIMQIHVPKKKLQLKRQSTAPSLVPLSVTKQKKKKKLQLSLSTIFRWKIELQQRNATENQNNISVYLPKSLKTV
jgi:hypothetical protein